MMGSVMESRLAGAFTLVLALFATACAHVGREDFEAEIASLRAEIEAQDNGMDGRNAAQIAALSARLDRLTDALTDLEGEFDVTVQRLETAIRFDVPVYFDFDRDELRPEDLPVLARFGDVVSEYYPNVLLTVEGFTDRAGSPEYNLDLGQRRAEAVRLYMTETAGFRADRVRAVSYGEAPERMVFPDRAGHDEGIENRRVALVIEHFGMEMDPPMASGGIR
jgi:peptidoglycan-associated lipoprotein